MTNVFSKVSAKYQIDELDGLQIKEGLKFFYALFFKSKDLSREYLLMRDLCVIYIQDSVIHCGNKENIPADWEELTYDEFRTAIAA